MSRIGRVRYGLSFLSGVALVAFIAAPAAAQSPAPADPNPGAMTLTGSFDVLNQYMFRGIRQNSTGVAMWPAMDLGIAPYSDEGGLKSVGINVGTWNSLHTGDTGSDGATSCGTNRTSMPRSGSASRAACRSRRPTRPIRVRTTRIAP